MNKSPLLFNGPINNTKSGIPVPLAYGRMEVGGAVVNFGFTDYRITGNQGYQFVSKGTSSGTGTGGGGGGSAGGKSNSEDSNWTQEEIIWQETHQQEVVEVAHL